MHLRRMILSLCAPVLFVFPGLSDFAVEWATRPEANAGGLSLFAALQAQLGLELKARKLPVPVLVIDSMEKTPTPN